MLKKSSTIIFMVIVFIFGASIPALSQGADFPSPTIVEDQSTGSLKEVGVRFSCLKAEVCLNENTCSTKDTSRVKITSDDSSRALPSDKNAYIMECVEFNSKDAQTPTNICTTGNSQLDKELFCNDANATDPQCDRATLLKEKIGYSLSSADDQNVGVFYKGAEGRFIRRNPPTTVETNSQGKIVPDTIEWQNVSNLRGITRRFMIVNKFKLDPVAQAGLGGQQQNDLSTGAQSSSCDGVAYDPYGRVFDMVSLEPIPEAVVALQQLDETTGTFSTAYAQKMNPHAQIDPPPGPLLANGVFTYYVVDGDYKLVPTKNGYTHPKQTEVEDFIAQSKNMLRIYSHLFFSDSEAIKQRGKIEQRDIPMKPSNPHGNTYPVVILSQREEIKSNGSNNTQITYKGKVSHPYAELQVAICSDITGEEVCRNTEVYTKAEGGPDKNGAFSITLDQSALQIENGEYFKKTFVPTNLAAANLPLAERFVTPFISYLKALFSITVSAAESDRSVSTRTQPIPTYIEGFAYDSQGNIIPHAQVEIYVDSLQFATFITEANENGYFKITTDHLPTISYSLKYNPRSNKYGQTSLTTAQFLAQNSEFIKQEKINPYLYAPSSSNPRANVTPTYIPAGKNTVISVPTPTTEPSPTKGQEASTSSTSTSPFYLIMALAVAIVLLVGSSIYWMIKKKTSTSI